MNLEWTITPRTQLPNDEICLCKNLVQRVFTESTKYSRLKTELKKWYLNGIPNQRLLPPCPATLIFCVSYHIQENWFAFPSIC